MSASDNAGGLIEHIQRAVIHALGALRCYITMLAAESEVRARRLLQEAVWCLVFVGIGLVGLNLFGQGLGTYIEYRLVTPGSGGMIVGGALAALCIVVFVVRALRDKE